MNSALLATALALVDPALALQAPTTHQILAIQTEIDAGKAIKTGALAANFRDLRAFEIEMGLRDRRGERIPGAPPFELALPILNEFQRVQYLNVLRQNIEIRGSMEAHFNSAVRLTLKAYGISDPDRPLRAEIKSGPPKPDIDDDNLRPSYLGRFATWDPKFTEELRENSKQYGATGDDGIVTLGIDAFTYPGKLAATLYHESIHFKELTTKGSDWMNVPATEVRVRTHTAQFERRIFHLNKTDLIEQAATLEVNRRAAPLWQKLLDEGFDPQRREHMQVLRGILKPPVSLPGVPPRAGNQDEALADIRSRADTLALRVEQDAQERRAYEQAESQRVANEEQRRQRISDTIRSLADAFCDAPVLADMRGQVIHSQWATVVREIELPPSVLDIDDMKFEGTCTQYLINQALFGKRIGRDTGSPEWLNFAVREGILRANGAAPLYERIRAAAPPPPPPQPTPPSPGNWNPDPVVEEPTVPPIPHCRYHDWCKEPKQKQRDQ